MFGNPVEMIMSGILVIPEASGSKPAKCECCGQEMVLGGRVFNDNRNDDTKRLVPVEYLPKRDI